ncbi:hypothetical protein HZU75_08420 [Chitinibacter fontanus]|uniref:Uncharacterized protein n=1 Tax=Chitinibacter fontanus TaxID=1737446 RepID=A0A7D5V9M6_9NEIS|nr:hypothetical protein [Chitinibacter fontanus]QLI81551.1 hypothetical protein HZU75_08420 [Chitinibacter fontanus]
MLALLLAFAAVWVALAIYGYWQMTNPAERDRSLQVYGNAVLTELAKTSSEREAMIVMATASEMFNTGLRASDIQSVMILQLNDLQGRACICRPKVVARN